MALPPSISSHARYTNRMVGRPIVRVCARINSRPWFPAAPALRIGAHSPRASSPATSPRSRRSTTTSTPLRFWAICRARSAIDRASRPRPCGAVGCETARVPAPARRRRIRRVSWDELTELLADELRRVVDTHGNEAIYGGSYGWASAGRFHHAQSQVHRFLKLLGGYTFSRHSYSLGATGVIMPRVVGTHDDLFKRSTEWEVIVEHTDLLVCFGGLALEEHRDQRTAAPPPIPPAMHCADSATGAGASCRSPRCATTSTGDCEWHAPVPGTDVAIMLALAHVLATESLADRDFLSTYCTGYDRFERYLLGVDDGVAKSPQWASAICGLPADDLVALARRMAAVPHDRDRQLVAAAHPARRAGAVDGADAGGDARPDRASRRRFRPRLRVDERAGPATAALPAAVAAAGPQPGADVHPRRGNQRHAAASRRAVRLQRQTPDVSRHQVGLLGRRQPVPPSPEHPAAAAGAGPRRHRGGPRPVLDGDGQARRHRRAVDDRVRTRRLLGFAKRSAVHGDACARPSPTPNPGTTTRHSRRWPKDSGSQSSSPRAAPRGSGWHISTTSGRPDWISRCRRSTSSGDCGRLRLPTETGLTLLGDFRADPVAPTGSALRVAASRSSPTTSTDSATTTAPVTRRGTSRRSGSADRGPRAIRCTCWPTSRRRGCTASSTAVRPVKRRKCKGASRSGCTRRDAAARGLVDGDVVRVFNDRGACLAGVVIDDRRAPRRRAAVDRRVVRPAGPVRSGRDVRARKSQRAHRRRRHVIAGARLHRCTRAGAGGEVRPAPLPPVTGA